MTRLKKRTLPFWLSVIAVTSLFGVFSYVSLAEDDIPPTLTNILVKEVSEDSATITWKTDDSADSQVNYGLTNNYGIIRNPLPDKKTHEITLTNLEAATTYHFRAVSSDEFGNQSVSGDFTLTTTGVIEPSKLEKVVEKKEEQQSTAKALALINEITDPDALVLIKDEVEDVAERMLAVPTIIGAPHIEDIGENYVVITWKTDRKSNSLISFVSEGSYDENATDPYTKTQGDSEEEVFEHTVEIVGLQPSTTYHFKVSSEDTLGLLGKSQDETFTTTSPIPVLRDLRITKVEETAATFSWSTTVPAAGYVEYTNLTTGEVKTAGSPELISGHTVRLTELEFGTRYSAVVYAQNGAGDKVTSDPMSFLTVRDAYPPVISKVANESTLYPSADNKIQTIVSWETDEPAYCTFYYRQGLSSSAEEASLDSEKEPTTDHVQVVVEFLPATVYKFWVMCEDVAKNSVKSPDFVLFTPIREKSIIDIILENFQSSFGWVKNIGK